jgi:hypothetical protein
MQCMVGVFATILDADGRVLLVHRTDCDWWCQPGGERQTSEETDDVRFFFPDELPANTFPEHVHRLRDALAGEPQTLLKVAQGPSSRDVARGSVVPEAG